MIKLYWLVCCFLGCSFLDAALVNQSKDPLCNCSNCGWQKYQDADKLRHAVKRGGQFNQVMPIIPCSSNEKAFFANEKVPETSLILRSILTGSIDLVRTILIAVSAQNLLFFDAHGRGPLHYAAWMMNADMIQLFSNPPYDFNVNQRSSAINLPLGWSQRPLGFLYLRGKDHGRNSCFRNALGVLLKAGAIEYMPKDFEQKTV